MEVAWDEWCCLWWGHTPQFFHINKSRILIPYLRLGIKNEQQYQRRPKRVKCRSCRRFQQIFIKKRNRSTSQRVANALKRKVTVTEPKLEGIWALTFKDAKMRRDTEERLRCGSFFFLDWGDFTRIEWATPTLPVTLVSDWSAAYEISPWVTWTCDSERVGNSEKSLDTL